MREPLINNESFRRDVGRTHAPFSILNPTTAIFHPVNPGSQSESTSEPATTYKWTSRNNHKGRHALLVNSQSQANSTIQPRRTTQGRIVLHSIWRMLTYYPVWDVSFDVAYIFTLGSVIWVINAFFSLLPFTNPAVDFDGETLYGGGITAFIGATNFEIGSILLMLEAVNENRSDCFGWAIEELFPASLHDVHSKDQAVEQSSEYTHHHQNKHNLVGEQMTTPEEDSKLFKRTWQWLPSIKELKSHYIHELGFLACSWQMFAATIFWISGFTALPGIFNILSPSLTNGICWVPQVTGGSGFIISGASCLKHRKIGGNQHLVFLDGGLVYGI